MSALAWLGVGLLGGFGALARFALSDAVMRGVVTGFPLGTLAVNLSGSLALGILVGASNHEDLFNLAATGLLGSFTTFSTWIFESERLAEGGKRGEAAANLAISLVLGVALAWIGLEIGEAL